MTAIGIMQGRLSPPLEGRIQAFPVHAWRDEFPRAAEAGLDCIEWVYELPNEDANPLATEAGVEEILAAAEASGVAVRSVCADYYMSVLLVADESAPAHLERLLARVGRLGARYVVLPFVDESSLADVAALEALLPRLLAAAERNRVELHLETDWPVDVLVPLLERFSHPLLRANYDTGNAASLGRRPGEELPALAPFLGSVHVKDRVLGGGTVPLGSGDADLPAALRLTEAAGFPGPYVLQVARGEDGGEVELARRNRDVVRALLAKEASWSSS
ncbi:MAG TPA: TIM barrel protein [Gaiellaceae bacterium]|nr:TIM barrel protein [Gaiellaceae bacterium]